MTNGGKGDVVRLAHVLARDVSASDYDFWRALKTVENELYQLDRKGLPIPIRLLHARRILRAAQRMRQTPLR